MLRLAETISDSRLLLWSHYLIGFNLQRTRRFSICPIAFGAEHCSLRTSKEWIIRFRARPWPTAMGMLAHVLHTFGYPDQALKCDERALTMARGLAHPYTLGWVLRNVVELLLRRGDYRMAEQLAAEVIALCTQHGFLSQLSRANFHHGFALVHLGRSEEGIAQMRQGLGATREAEPYRLWIDTYRPERSRKLDRARKAIAIVDELLSLRNKVRKGGTLRRPCIA